jgi:hypothetical protein
VGCQCSCETVRHLALVCRTVRYPHIHQDADPVLYLYDVRLLVCCVAPAQTSVASSSLYEMNFEHCNVACMLDRADKQFHVCLVPSV